MSYTRVGAAHASDRKSACIVLIFVIIVGASFFVALGGIDALFPVVEDPEQSQLYRLYVIIEPKSDNFTVSFYSEIIVFNETIIADKFSIRVYENTTSAKGSGNLLWSLNTIDQLTLEIESVTPVGFEFHWFDTIKSSVVSELAPSETNMYEWLFEYGSLYWIRVQLGPKLTVTT